MDFTMLLSVGRDDERMQYPPEWLIAQKGVSTSARSVYAELLSKQIQTPVVQIPAVFLLLQSLTLGI